MLSTTLEELTSPFGALGGVFRPAFSPDAPVTLKKRFAGSDTTAFGAFPRTEEGTALELSLSLPRRAGASAVAVVLRRDGGEEVSLPMTFSGTDLVRDRYTLSGTLFDLPEHGACGLYFWYLAVSFGNETLVSRSVNNLDFSFGVEPEPFHFLLYDPAFHTPKWFPGCVMYQIFVDRFFRGSTPVPVSDAAVLHKDWDNETPQYGAYPGAFVKNNDFFGGTLYGVCEKLDYLKSLGVDCLYLNPVFCAVSNHKYDTGDYRRVDPMFGGDEALETLLSETKKRGMRVILDGVFNHTGDDSLYFDRYERYGQDGAYAHPDSPYRDWYYFDETADPPYRCWWGIEILPKLNLNNPACASFFTGKDGVLRTYLRRGASGWRLDVADELPSAFLDALRTSVKTEDPEALIIGEVWENAAVKVAYGQRRPYFLGKQLDSVMNYPLKNAIIAFVRDGDGDMLYNTATELLASYPKKVTDCLMNLLGTHDTERILTVLAGDSPEGLSNDELAKKRMTQKQRQRGIAMLKVASVLQFTLFGVPSVYYGDEAGMEGYHDPFCRMPYPWGREDAELVEHYRFLGKLRRKEPAFKDGETRFLAFGKGFVAFTRTKGGDELLILVNTGQTNRIRSLPEGTWRLLADGTSHSETFTLAPMTAAILKKEKNGSDAHRREKTIKDRSSEKEECDREEQ